MSVGNDWKMTNFGCYSTVSPAREDGADERGYHGKAGKLREAETATWDRMMWRILFLFPLLAFSCAWYCNALLYNRGLVEGFPAFLFPGFFFFFFQRVWWWARLALVVIYWPRNDRASSTPARFDFLCLFYSAITTITPFVNSTLQFAPT